MTYKGNKVQLIKYKLNFLRFISETVRDQGKLN